jgi:hypothetical protein
MIVSSWKSEGFIMADNKRRKDKSKSTLSSMQEVTYSREFRMADRAGGFISNKRNS